ncbi:MAG: Crp/Fnr family transcriptional regulator [Mariprofundales bacterium]|nr:Crp/Fnr family transcriptional regulator [Mariprofundales bacterium]
MIEHLRHIPLFANLDDDKLASIAHLGHINTIPANSMILQEGDKGTSLFVILEGSVKICYYAADGHEIILSVLGRDQFFGEMALLACEPRSATAITITASRLAQIHCHDFKQLLKSNPDIAVSMLSEVTNRLRQTSQVLERLSTLNVPARLYMLILDRCHKAQRLIPTSANRSSVAIELPTHQLLADQIATSRETVTRAIGRLKKDSIIKHVEGKKNIFQVDIQSLNTLTQMMI